MKNLITKKRLVFSLAMVLLLSSLVFYSLRIMNRNIYQNTEIKISHINQIPYIGEHLKEIDSEGDIKCIERNTLGVIEVLFTGHITKENINKLYENDQWYHISAVSVKNSLGDICKDFNVVEKDYPVSYTEEDVVIDRPLFQNIKLKINYIPSKDCFTGKATIYNR